MNEYVFGANILENLTTGMYQDSKVIYREYIQNACDQIDKAVREGLISQKEGYIHIWLESDKRTIIIEDNATGISSADFKRTLGNIADSDKRIGENKGFRGIGRLCGLAYCKELLFTSTFKGETVISTMRCNAQKMRELISKNGHAEKLTANYVLNEINEFSTYDTADVDAHWFKVELIGINDENTDLLDFSQIKEYLSFVAPVPYINTFIFRSEIHEHAKKIKYSIDEYNITLNGELVVKKYKANFKTSKGDDEIFGLEFKDIIDANGNLLAWIWWGISRFKGVIQKDCQMRGLRLRKENIQIGNDDALQKLFKEDRGHHYFVGEVYAVAKDLIPNSQRDYFRENDTRNLFERELKLYFNDELKAIYYGGSAINSAFDKIESAAKKEAEFRAKEAKGEFVNTIHREAELAEIEKAKVKAGEAKAKIEKEKQKADEKDNAVTGRLIERIKTERTTHSSIATPIATHAPNDKVKDTKISWRTDKLPTYNKQERKLISKIFSIIVTSTDKETAESIIKRIEEELQ